MISNDFDAKAFLKIAPESPGVYRMLSSEDTVLYVGKAKNLRKRLSSYFQKNLPSKKTTALVKLIKYIDIDVTNTELEALLLEQNYIKSHKPKYNILLRDDKSYPYIFLSADPYPRLVVHRGAKKKQGKYFGPFPSAGAVKETLNLLQKLFSVRQCENSYFSNRNRPCLQHQIKRCKAPCVNYLTEHEYAVDVSLTELLLKGKHQQTLDSLVSNMEHSARLHDYEDAAVRRDQISSLREIISQQVVESDAGDLDVVALAIGSNLASVQVMFIRSGRVIGSRNFEPKIYHHTDAEVLSAFIAQFYLNGKDIPNEVITNIALPDSEVLQLALIDVAGKKVQLKSVVREQRLRWLKLSIENAKQALLLKVSSASHQQQRLLKLVSLLKLAEIPKRLECFDISHTSGQQTVASCVVFGQEGPIKNLYRKYNILNITPGDDYAAMEQVLKRRFSRLADDNDTKPDILFIDGGKGQIKQAEIVLDGLKIKGILVIGVAKGSERKAGSERLFIPGKKQPIIVDEHNSALHLIQHIRDESHRFAITGHRKIRDNQRKRSVLEEISGIGPKRRQNLLKQFGGLQQLKKAAVADIMSVPGFDLPLAQKIYDYFRES